MIISIIFDYNDFNYITIKKNTYNLYKKIENSFHKSYNITENALFNEKIVSFPFRIKVALCVIIKQENIYIKEFVDYYKNLGIKKIYLYDNNELDGENLEEILKEEINIGFIKVINFRGLFRPQYKAYNDCYINNKFSYDWIAFYDVDEFLYFENYTNINKFLSLPKFKNCSSILINWKYYGDNENIFYKPNSLKKRFTKPFYFEKNKVYDKAFYSAAKSIVRGGLNISWKHFPHFLNNSNICKSTGDIVKQALSPPDYTSAYIKHYATKSTEEYIIKLFKGTVNSNITLSRDSVIFWFKNYYFLFNKITRKKIFFL